MKLRNNKIVESLKIEIGKKDNEMTTFQIRIYDDTSGAVAYKYLNGQELFEIIKLLDKDLDFS